MVCKARICIPAANTLRYEQQQITLITEVDLMQPPANGHYRYLT